MRTRTNLKSWQIFMACREGARQFKDPCFGTVEAETKEEAEEEARKGNFIREEHSRTFLGAWGYWAVPIS